MRPEQNEFRLLANLLLYFPDMPPSAYPITAQERDAATQRWIVIFVLLSILAHLLLIAVIALLNHFIPTPKFKEPVDPTPATTLSLQQEPAPTPPHKLFMPTDPDALAKPNPKAPVESDNDARLKSMSKEARDASAIMPDVTADKTRTHDLKTRPNKPSPKPDLVAPPPSPQTAAAKQPPTPPQPQPQKANPAQQAPKPTPPKPPTPTPPKPTPAAPSKTTVDPATGLPVLPPINAPTLAPETAVSTASIPNPVSTSLPEEASSSHGALGTHGDNSPEAMATEFGRYKAKVYRAVGARWYPKVNDHFQVMPVGLVHVQFIIHSDGQVDTKVLEGDTSNLQMLLSISINSIRESAPFDPFTDTLKQEIIKEQGGDGESYTDDFTFSIYGD
jgi:outer membrane biosynthesis protein TonB